MKPAPIRTISSCTASRYAALDPLTIGHYFGELEQPLAVADLLPYEEFQRTQFYKEWVRPQGTG